jgi:hypothetical protein
MPVFPQFGFSHFLSVSKRWELKDTQNPLGFVLGRLWVLRGEWPVEVESAGSKIHQGGGWGWDFVPCHFFGL